MPVGASEMTKVDLEWIDGMLRECDAVPDPLDEVPDPDPGHDVDVMWSTCALR